MGLDPADDDGPDPAVDQFLVDRVDAGREPQLLVIADGMEAYSQVREARSVIAHREGVPVLAAASGLLFMPNRQADMRPEDDGFFVVRRIGPVWLRLSAILRREPGSHFG